MKRAGVFPIFVGVFLAVAVSAQTIPDQINAILSRADVAGNSWSVLVENANGSVVYYQRNPTAGLAPASNTKMFTTAVAFGLLGTNYAFQTRIYFDGTFSGGVLTGNLNLVCEHDPTWNTSVFGSGNARRPLDTIAAALQAQGLVAVNGNVQCYGVCAYNFGSTANLASTTTQAKNATAATAFVAALNARGITVSGSALGQTGFNPPGTLRHTYYSTNNTYGGRPLRLDVACIPLNKPSHNVMADLLLRHIGWRLAGTDSYAAGRNLVLPWLRNVAGLNTNGIVMNDGSGLSHGNRFSARQTIDLTRFMLNAFPSWDDTLPVGCVDGTLGSRFCGTPGSGSVRAKTGSLSISIALSGYIDNPNDNQRYLFSFIANQSGINQSATRDAIDDAVVLFGNRGVPIGPRIQRVVSRPDGTSLQVFWANDDFVRVGYRVYGSSNGINFNWLADVTAGTHSYVDSGLQPGTKKYYRVSVLGAAGESKPSRVYGARAGGSPRVLIVDGNDRWQFQTAENPQCTNHNFCAIAGQNINGAIFETAHQSTISAGTVRLTNYPAVIWLAGEEGTDDESFSSSEQALVASYLNAKGNLFVSGAEIGWDLDRTSGPSAADRNFYRTQLRAAFASDDANTYAFAPVAGGIFSGNLAGGFDNGTRGTYNVSFPDVLLPTNGSVAALAYVGGTGGTAAIQFDGSPVTGKLVHWGFPFETITNSVVRDDYMRDVLKFFDVQESPRLSVAQLDTFNNAITLTWNASVGLTYRVQFKNNLTDALWQNLPGDVIATNSLATKTDSPPPGTTRRFYRVQMAE